MLWGKKKWGGGGECTPPQPWLTKSGALNAWTGHKEKAV